MTLKTKILLALLLLSAMLAGIYLAFPGPGRVVEAYVWSVNNSNTLFNVHVVTKCNGGQDLPPFPLPSSNYWHRGVWGKDALFCAYALDRDCAEAVAKLLHVPCLVRKDPGHKLVATVRPVKENYGIGEQVLAVFELRNDGPIPVRFARWGCWRDDKRGCYQIKITRRGDEQGVFPEVGISMIVGGKQDIELRTYHTSGEMVDLSRWCSFSESGEYKVSCRFQTEIRPLLRDISRMIRPYEEQKEAMVPWEDVFEAETKVTIGKR